MATVSLGRKPSRAILPRQWAVCDVKQTWDGKWKTIADLRPQEAVIAAAPEVDAAEFLWRAGNYKFPSKQFVHRDPLDFQQWYCRIRCFTEPGPRDPAPEPWVAFDNGFFEEDTQLLQSADWPKGPQKLRAYGIAHLLDRNGLTKAWVQEVDDVDPIQIGWVPSFNAAGTRGLSLKGNRTAAPDGDGVYLFGGSEVWTHHNIAEYILAKHPQAERLAEQDIYLELAGPGAEMLHRLRSVFEFKDRSIWHCLNELIKPEMGLGFFPVVQQKKSGRTIETTIYLWVFTLADKEYKVGGESIEANPDTLSFTLPTAWPDTHLVEPTSIRTSTANVYNVIVARGQRVKVCCTFAYEHDTFERGWSGSTETAYQSAGGGTAQARDTYRTADRFAAVYADHLVPSPWDFRAGQVESGDVSSSNRKTNVAPLMTPQGIAIFQLSAGPHCNFEKEFFRELPLLEHRDYSVSPPASTADATDEEKYRPMVAFINDAFNGVEHVADQKWKVVDRLSEGDSDLKAASVRSIDAQLGVTVQGSPRHYFARTHWTNSTDLTENFPELDYELLVVTAFFATDATFQATWTGEGESNEFERVLTLDVADAELWYIAPGTAVDVDAVGKLKAVHRANCYVRNDVARLWGTLAFAAAFYGVPRQAVKIPIKRLGWFVDLGTMIDSIEMVQYAKPIRTPVTAKRMDFREPGTTIETGYCQFDAVGFVQASAPQRRATKRAKRGAGIVDARVKPGGRKP